MRWNTFLLLKTLIITMKCLVKLALLTKAKMQVCSYLLVDNYSCVFVADMLIYVCVKFPISLQFTWVFTTEGKTAFWSCNALKNLTKTLPELSLYQLN